MPDSRITPGVIYKAVLLAFGLVIGAMIFRALSSLVLGVLIVVIVAAPLAAFADLLQKWRCPRAIGATLGLLIGLGAIAGLVALIVPVFSREVNHFVQELPHIGDSLSRRLGRLTGSSPAHISSQVQHYVNGYTRDPSKLLGPLASVGASVKPARSSRVGPEVGGRVPAVDVDRRQLAGSDELGHPRLRVAPGQPEVVAEVRFGSHTERAGGDAHELALGVGRAGGRPLADACGDHALGRVVEPLEVDPPGSGDLPGEEQMLECPLSLVPVPHVSRPGRWADGTGVPCTDRALAGDQLERVGDQIGLLAGHPGDRAPGLPIDVGHPPAKQRVELERNERCLVGPVLHEPPVDPTVSVSGDAVQAGAVVGSQAGVDRHVVRAQEHVDRVELEHAELLYEIRDPRGAGRSGRSRAAESLGGQGNPPGGGLRQLGRDQDSAGSHAGRSVGGSPAAA